MLSANSSCFVIQSRSDKQKFNITQNIINSSALLKNIYDLTQVSEPIAVDCNAKALNTFIRFMKHYDTVVSDTLIHDKKFEKTFFRKFKDDQLIQLVQDLYILDCDFFVDSVADCILGKMIASDPHMSWKEIMELLGIEEDDYTVAERKMIENNRLEYFLSMDMKTLKFPFPKTNFYQLKTKFASSMNAFLARIIQHSSPDISFQISLINKTLKNEVDRYPLKLKHFRVRPDKWVLYFTQGFDLYMDLEKLDKNYFNILKSRGVDAEEFSLHYHPYTKDPQLCDSLNFAIPNDETKTEITFYNNLDLMFHFDITKCPMNSLLIDFANIDGGGVPFKSVLDHLMKDKSKKIELVSYHSFGFFQQAAVKLYKEASVSKFHMIYIQLHGRMMLAFKDFVENYMEDDGIIKSLGEIRGIPIELCFTVDVPYYFYNVSVMKEHLENFFS